MITYAFWFELKSPYCPIALRGQITAHNNVGIITGEGFNKAIAMTLGYLIGAIV